MSVYDFNNLLQLVGKKAQLKDEQGNEIELAVAEVKKGRLDGDEWEAFSVIYHAGNNSLIPQGTYTITHESLGDNLLFLSPKSETEYEVVVTRRRIEMA